MAEPNNEEVKSRRQSLKERMLSRYPDLDVNDDEALAGRISDDYDELDGQLNGYKEREGKLTNMMNADPRSAHFLSRWAAGEDPVMALVRLFREDIRTILDDPDSEASQELARISAEDQDSRDAAEANTAKTKAIVAQWKEENGLSDEEANEVLDSMQKFLEDALEGNVSRESLDLFRNGLRHDEDVASAADDAEVRGRNAKINETLRKRQEGDGVAPLGGSAGKVNPQRPKSILQLAREEEMGM